MKAQNTYEDLRKKYESYEHNDQDALPFVKVYINKAKTDKNYKALTQGYEVVMVGRKFRPFFMLSFKNLVGISSSKND